MVCFERTIVRSVACGVLGLLICGSGGCVRNPCPWLVEVNSPRPFLSGGCLRPCGAACAVDPVCYGFNATCWYSWPAECGGCPIGVPCATESPMGGMTEDGPDPTLAPLPAEAPLPPVLEPPDEADLEVPTPAENLGELRKPHANSLSSRDHGMPV